MPKNVAIIMRNHLETIGLSNLLSNRFNAVVSVYDTFDEIPLGQRDKFRLFVTTEDEFLKNLSFFMPHNDSTVIVSAALNDKSYNVVSPFDDEEKIVSRFETFFLENVVTEDLNHLTQREITVLQLVVEGLINKEIADRLNISVNTVLTHRKNITAKLGIKSVSGLSVYAIMNGIVSPK